MPISGSLPPSQFPRCAEGSPQRPPAPLPHCFEACFQMRLPSKYSSCVFFKVVSPSEYSGSSKTWSFCVGLRQPLASNPSCTRGGARTADLPQVRTLSAVLTQELVLHPPTPKQEADYPVHNPGSPLGPGQLARTTEGHTEGKTNRLRLMHLYTHVMHFDFVHALCRLDARAFTLATPGTQQDSNSHLEARER